MKAFLLTCFVIVLGTFSLLAQSNAVTDTTASVGGMKWEYHPRVAADTIYIYYNDGIHSEHIPNWIAPPGIGPFPNPMFPYNQPTEFIFDIIKN